MAQTTNLILKKTYDQYIPGEDFHYGQPGSDNLNPVREVKFDQMDIIVKRLQEITDDIIRKQIALPEPEPPLEMPNGEMPAKGIPPFKQALIANSGGTGALIFPIIKDAGPLDKVLENIIGTFPPVNELLDELDEPPEIDCDIILANLFATRPDIKEIVDPDGLIAALKDKADNEDDSDDDDDSDNDDDDDDGGGSDDNDDDDDDNDNDSDTDNGDTPEPPAEPDEPYPGMEECPKLELSWLKIILVLVKIINIIKKIILFVMAILMPIIEIVRLAVGAWLNPPNIVKIAQIILQMVVAIVLMILAMLLQLIWNLLNFDCVMDNVNKLINEIKAALSAFSSIMNMFNPTSISMMLNKNLNELLDPLVDLKEDLAKGGENWKNFAKQFTSGEPWQEMWEETKKQTILAAQEGVMGNPNIQQVAATAEKVKGAIEDAKKAKESVIDTINQWKNAKALFKKGLSGAAKKWDTLTSPTITNAEFTNKET
jgi:hypothetical protein